MVEAFGDAQHERAMNGHCSTALLHVLPSVNAFSCGAVQLRYYLENDDSRNDPRPRMEPPEDPLHKI